jgi:hypothetical protein
MITTIAIAWHSRLLTSVWWAARLVVALSFVFFVALYYFAVVPTGYYATDRAVAAQGVALGAFVLAWCAVGNPARSIGLGALAIYLTFAVGLASMLTALVLEPQAIKEYSQTFPEWDGLTVGLLGADGPVILFLAWIGLAALFLFAGTVAAVVLRWLRFGQARRTLRQIDRDSRAAIGGSGDAPSLLRLLAWRRWRGWLYGLAAVVALMAPVVFSGREFSIPAAGGLRNLLPDTVARIVVAATDRWLALLIALPLAFLLWRRARSHLAPAARIVLSADRRPPILLLRSFDDDRAAVPAVALWRRLLAFTRLSRHRLEEVAATTLRRIGPFIAVGDPRRGLPPLGAFRARLGDDEWRDRVREWMQTARVVVIVAGAGAGLRWELQAAAELGVLKKVVLLMPPGSEAETAARWSHVAESISASPWAGAFAHADAGRVLSVTFTDGGWLELVEARARREQDYSLALSLGLHCVISS